jgi:hypothetical protein
MKFKSLLLVVGFIPALAMAEVAKPAPEKAPPVGARPVVGVTHVYHHHYYYHLLKQEYRPMTHEHHLRYFNSLPPPIPGGLYGPNQNAQGYCGNAGNPC